MSWRRSGVGRLGRSLSDSTLASGPAGSRSGSPADETEETTSPLAPRVVLLNQQILEDDFEDMGDSIAHYNGEIGSHQTAFFIDARGLYHKKGICWAGV